MPATDKLSCRLHETLGDEAAGDMVNWMQQVDSHRSELRELNELNFSRFDARWTALDQRFDALNERFDTRFNQRTAELRQEMRVGFAELRQEIAQRSADLLKWSFVFWVGAVGAIAALAGALR